MKKTMGIEWFQVGEIGRCLSFSAFSAKIRTSLVPNLIIVVCLYWNVSLYNRSDRFALVQLPSPLFAHIAVNIAVNRW
jgi:hypothetical protein